MSEKTVELAAIWYARDIDGGIVAGFCFDEKVDMYEGQNAVRECQNVISTAHLESALLDGANLYQGCILSLSLFRLLTCHFCSYFRSCYFALTLIYATLSFLCFHLSI